MNLSSRAAKLSSWAAAELTYVVMVVVELTAVVVAATHVAAVVVVVAMTQVTAVVVASPNWKIQSLPHQTQCPSCTIGHDSQHSIQVYIPHSLQGIPACFYGGQVSPCPHVL
jgi:hypothetical protein